MRPLRPLLLLATSTLLSFLLAPTAAHALRCNHRLVLRGDPAPKAIALCGQPLTVHRTVEYRTTTLWTRYGREERTEAVPVEYWLYDFGPQRLQRLLEFERGLLRDEHTLGYGLAPAP